MEYKVVHSFRDLQDKTKKYPNGRVYAVGDSYPGTKRKISEERLNELLTKDNKIGKPVIVKVGE